MVSINEIYQDTVSIAQKAKHGTIRIDDFNRYANLATMDLFNEKIGPARDLYKLGKAIPKSSPGMDKGIDQCLRPYLVSDLSLTVVGGVVPIPSDSEYIDTVTAGNVEVKWVPKYKIKSYLNSTIDIPTVAYPIYNDLDTQLDIYPTSITSILLNYYKTPETVKWAYTLVNNRPVYTATGTVDFSWYPTQKLELLTRILGYVGVTIRDSELTQYAATQENTIA